MQKMTKIYFSQTEIYYSESKDSMLKIQDMDPTHAGNAARRLLQDSQGWAQDAGCTGHAHASWMLSTPLWNALYQRARGPGGRELGARPVQRHRPEVL